MATAKRFRDALLAAIGYAQNRATGDVGQRASAFADFLTGNLGGDEPEVVTALRQLLDLPAVPTGDGA